MDDMKDIGRSWKISASISASARTRSSHPLGEFVINATKNRPCPPAEVVFEITGHSTRIAVVERLKGKSG